MHQAYNVCDFLVTKLQQHKHLQYFILSAFEWSIDITKIFIRKYY